MSTSLPITPARRPVAPLVAFVILVLGALFLQNSVGSRQVLLLSGRRGTGLDPLPRCLRLHLRLAACSSNERRGAGFAGADGDARAGSAAVFPGAGGGHVVRAASGRAGGAGRVSVVFGAFIFGIGMQLGGGCASGMLFTVGGGNARMLVTLSFFYLRLADRHTPCGLVVCVAGCSRWLSIVKSFGVVPALLASLAMFALDRGRHRASGEAPPRPA